MEPSSPARPNERRAIMRQRALLAGKLATSEAAETIDCVIRNISAVGAMVETTSPHLIPNELHLVQINEGIAFDAEVIWRRGNRVGLRLKDRHDLRKPVADQLKVLRAIWSHMAR
jgi:hypothetical protein